MLAANFWHFLDLFTIQDSPGRKSAPAKPTMSLNKQEMLFSSLNSTLAERLSIIFCQGTMLGGSLSVELLIAKIERFYYAQQLRAPVASFRDFCSFQRNS